MGKAGIDWRGLLAGGAAIVLGLTELLLAGLRPPSIHRLEWMAPKVIVFAVAYVLARVAWLDKLAPSESATMINHDRADPPRGVRPEPRG